MLNGYMGKILLVDLTHQKVSVERLDEKILRPYVGGSGFAIPWVYREVGPGVEWSSPENHLVLATGPLSGTVGGTGSYSVATKGPMTNGMLSVQANGYLGAFLKFAGFDAIVMHGNSPNWVYLYVHDGTGELKPATNLLGKNTWETEDAIKAELGKTERQMSVHGIGPAGENLVRFACIVGDRGHVAAHGGVGAVMGAKKLKAIAVERGMQAVPVHDKKALRAIAKKTIEEVKANSGFDYYNWGTSLAFPGLEKLGFLPVKNYQEYKFSATEEYYGKNFRPLLKEKRDPCWACQHHHCSIVEISEGPYAGFIGEEPEYEGLAAMGSLTDQKDVLAAIVMCNEADRYGIDINETGWLLSWLMDCNEKKLLTKNDTDGIDMTWGNVDSMRAMMRKIVYRQGFGNTLAEGAKRAAKSVGGEAADRAIYTTRGNTPRGHDHRRSWVMMMDTALSDYGVDEEGLLLISPEALGLPSTTDPLTPEGVALILATACGITTFYDTLVLCKNSVNGANWTRCIEMLNAVTGWDFTAPESKVVMRRIKNMARAFNIRHGVEKDGVSPRYGSSPAEGTGAGKSFAAVADRAIDCYHEAMGWEKETGKPLPETLKDLGLDYIVKDLWTGSKTL